jgi:glucokinase
MLLAGDVGGTNTRLGLFERGRIRPEQIAIGIFPTLEYSDLTSIIAEFAKGIAASGIRLEAACFGVAGPVIGESAELTNVPWRIDARRIAEAFDISRIQLLNDLQAMAHAVPVLGPSELHVLQTGHSSPTGNMALIAAGTGLGEAILHRVNGRFVPVSSEAGHADFAARTEPEIDLLRSLIHRYGHAEVEHVVSGAGLVNLHRVVHRQPCEVVVDLRSPDAAAAISKAALAKSCRGCVETLNMFVEAYGAEAGNLALRSTALAGVYVGGGIAPKILPALDDGRFVRAFSDKMPLFRKLLASVPVKVILNDEAGLLGAAVYAAAL